MIPRLVNPSDVDMARLAHRDLDTLDAAEAWAERKLVELALATRLRRRQRPLVLWHTAGGSPITDTAWLEERLRRLCARRTSHVGA